MNIGHDSASAFDARLRQVHASAVSHVSPRTRLQLRPQRSAAPAPRSRLHAWPIAATCAIALAAGGLFLRTPFLDSQTYPPVEAVTATSAAPASDGDAGEIYAALDESPELYLWLASNDTDTLVLE